MKGLSQRSSPPSDVSVFNTAAPNVLFLSLPGSFYTAGNATRDLVIPFVLVAQVHFFSFYINDLASLHLGH